MDSGISTVSPKPERSSAHQPLWPYDELVADREAALAARRWVPGEPGLWALIFTDLGVFSVYFIEVMLQWRSHPAIFAAGHREIDLAAGILNSFCLLTASLGVALGVQTLRLGKVGATKLLFVGAGISGSVFVANKFFEWGAKLAHGFTPTTDQFFQLYFVITGIHLAHVLIAMLLLFLMYRRAERVINSPTPRQARFIENCATYWHMVDLLWLGIFALFYLMR